MHGWQLWSLYESLTFPHLVPWDSCTASTATPPSQTRASRRGRHFFLRSSQEIFSSRCLEMCHIPSPNCHGLGKSEFLSLRTSSANRTDGNCWAGQLHCLLFSVRKHSHCARSSKCQLCKLAHGSPEDLVNYSALRTKETKEVSGRPEEGRDNWMFSSLAHQVCQRMAREIFRNVCWYHNGNNLDTFTSFFF